MGTSAVLSRKRPKTRDIVQSVKAHIAEVEIELAMLTEQLEQNPMPYYPPKDGDSR